MQSKDCLDGWTEKKDEWIDGGIDRYRHTDVILVYKLFIKVTHWSCWAFGGWMVLSFIGLILGSRISEAFTETI